MKEKAEEAFNSYDFQNAATWAGDALLLAEIEVGKKSVEYADLLGDLGIYKYYNYQYEEGIQHVEDACILKKELLGESDENYLLSYSDLGSLYYMNGENLKAEQVFINTVNAQRKKKPGSVDLAYELNKLGLVQTNLANYIQAEKNLKECRRIFEAKGMSKSVEFASILNNLANLYHSMGNYLDAEEYYGSANKLYAKTDGKESPSYATGVQNLANLYGEMGRYDEAKELILESLEINKNVFGEKSMEYARSLNDLAYTENHLGDYIKSEEMYRTSLDIKLEVAGSRSQSYNRTRNNLAVLYMNYGNLNSARTTLEDLVEKTRVEKSSDPYAFTTYAQNLVVLYLQSNEIDKAESLQNELYEMYRELGLNNNHEWAMLLNNTAEISRRKNNPNGSIDLLRESLTTLENLGHDKSMDYLTINYQLGISYMEADMLEPCINILEFVLEEARKNLNEKNELYLNTLINLGEARRRLKQYNTAKPLYSQAMDTYSEILREDFMFMSVTEKTSFYDKMRLHHALYNSFALEASDSDPSIWNQMFNYNIQFKNINLISTRHQKELMANSGQSSLNSKYNEWKSNREYLNKLYQVPKNELKMAKVNIDSIERKTTGLEKELYASVSRLNENRKVDLDMIEKSLDEGQVAVEIIRVPHYGKNTDKLDVDYVALIVYPKGENKMKSVVIKDGERLDNEVSDLFFDNIFSKKTDENSYHLFWKDIADQIDGYSTVFLSRSGIYNIVNVNALKIFGSDEYVVDKWDVHYVTSTARIFEKKNPLRLYEKVSCIDRIHLFGYPNYYLGEATDLIASTDVASQSSTTGRQIDAELMFISELPGTKEEVESINDILVSKGYQPKVYLDREATETNIKSLQSPCVLHIATHGFFEFDLPQLQNDNSTLNRSMNISRPLLRSGIMMAGSAYSLNLVKDNVPFLEEFEDGVLNGFEASNLNLEETDLVVLSACLTSVGDAKINDNEGYFGMLSAFLSAGAHNVIASNWAVDDIATKELMISFYSNWEQDKDVHEAFRKAQIETKEKYSQPYFWGAFILVE